MARDGQCRAEIGYRSGASVDQSGYPLVKLASFWRMPAAIPPGTGRAPSFIAGTIRRSDHVVDNLRHSADSLAARDGQLLHAGRVHSPAPEAFGRETSARGECDRTPVPAEEQTLALEVETGRRVFHTATR